MSGHSGGSTMKLYRYDEFNRLIKYNDDGTEAKYTYGVDNLRATKTVNGTTTSYVWNGQNLASETKNNATTVYYYDPLGVNGAKTDNDTFVRYIKDPHGNVVATSKNNALFGTYDYTAFGNQLEATDTTNPFRYCGEYYDEESGLTYLRNRYYNSNTGRFITEDPAKDELNWYVYGNNNPVMFIDPLGLNDEKEKSGCTLPGYENKDDFRFKALQELTDDTLDYIDGKLQTVESNNNGNKSVGTALVRELVSSPIPVEIKYYNKQNYEVSPKYNNPLKKDMIIGATIYIDTKMEHPYFVENLLPNQINAIQPVIPYVNMGHELHHQ